VVANPGAPAHPSTARRPIPDRRSETDREVGAAIERERKAA
jgi:hypothetical protein